MNVNTDLFYTASDLVMLLGTSKASAYRLIKRLNEELEAKGFLTIRGKVSKRYLDEKLYVGSND